MSFWKQFPQDPERPKDRELVWCSWSPEDGESVKCYYVEEGWGPAHFIRQDTVTPYFESCFWRPIPPLFKVGHNVVDNLTSLLTVLESFITKGK